MYIAFTIKRPEFEIEFGYSYGDGLIIQDEWLNPEYLFNHDFNVAMRIAFEMSPGLRAILAMESGQWHKTYQELELIWKLRETIRNNDVGVHGGKYDELIDKASRAYIEHKQQQLADALIKSKRGGFVYLLNGINGQHYKIGRAKEPNNRIKTFSVKLPFRVEYDALIPTADMFALEAELHAKFADKRIDGEWFALEPADVEYIKSLAVQP